MMCTNLQEYYLHFLNFPENELHAYEILQPKRWHNTHFDLILNLSIVVQDANTSKAVKFPDYFPEDK